MRSNVIPEVAGAFDHFSLENVTDDIEDIIEERDRDDDKETVSTTDSSDGDYYFSSDGIPPRALTAFTAMKSTENGTECTEAPPMNDTDR